MNDKKLKANNVKEKVLQQCELCDHLIKDSENKPPKSTLIDAMTTELKSSSLSESNKNKFIEMFTRYISSKKRIDWSKVNPINEKLTIYDDLVETDSVCDKLNLSKLAVIKLNGGLGTTMGCKGPKSAINVKEDKSFLDLVVKQMEHLHKTSSVCVPLIFMNSFNTQKPTEKMLQKYQGIRTFTQSEFPRIIGSSLMPMEGPNSTYPPGHGDLFISIYKSGILDQLLDEGKEILFVSNIDNLAATVDPKILNFVLENEHDFCMEVTNKTRADVKGGTLINYDGKIKLLELAEVPENCKSEFTSLRKFKIFNTNSIYINIRALKKKMENGGLNLDIIENKKTVRGEMVIQLESAIGSAIKFFDKPAGIIVPRTRFLPVKSCSDLFALRSTLFEENNGTLTLSKLRGYQTLPLIKLLGEKFQKITTFEAIFKSPPDLIELDHLTVTGEVLFGKNVVLKGTVIIIASKGSVIHIPDGSVLDDCILCGNLPIIEH
ncbi:UTP--glucose-1-phosphate uridylyltransferase [Cucumispora dikerogammari]|nr:UTP--glucose-1-phosphate uridylyltransferase [Cucumispora dikerogammari]